MLTEKDLLKNKIFQELINLPISLKDFIIVDKAILGVFDIIKISEIEKLDILVTQTAQNTLQNLNFENTSNKINILTQWADGQFSMNDLIRNTFKVGDFQFLSLKEYLEFLNKSNPAQWEKTKASVKQFMKANPKLRKYMYK